MDLDAAPRPSYWGRMQACELVGGTLTLGGEPLLARVSDEVTLEAARFGAFLRTQRPSPAARFKVSLGSVSGLVRLVGCHRYEPFWMKPVAGARVAALPSDTQYVLCELASGRFALLVPLVLDGVRVCLEGKEDELWAVADSGDPFTRSAEALLAFVAIGEDPYLLLRSSAAMVAQRLGTGKLRKDKPLPAFVDDFGWCTWDAFYFEVSHQKVREGLESFRLGGVEPRFLILDDGWQCVRPSETGEKRLCGLGADPESFPEGLSATVRLAKQEYRVKTFLVWHAIHGYWGGLDREAFPDCGVTDVLRWYSPEILGHAPAFNWDWWGACVGRPSCEGLARFYADYHARLASEGVDGLKVDNQASVEGLAHGAGGRVAVMRQTSRALEDSVGRHFAGRLINCMGCANDRLYQTESSTLMRTSTDFWPDLPASHGAHVYTNALVSLWFGEFVHPDWDMFQSGHLAGSYHAAARAVSGGAVYVSDKPDAHDFALLRRLVLYDGSVLRARGVGLPTRDCLFGNPLEEPILFKVFNLNLDSGVVGIFNARYRSSENRIEGTVSPADVPELGGEEHALYFTRSKRLCRARRVDRISLTLDTLEWEIATIVPLDRGVAPIGLADKLNPAGAIRAKGWNGARYSIALRDGGALLVHAEHRPERVLSNGQAVAFDFTPPELTVSIPGSGPQSVEIVFSAAP